MLIIAKNKRNKDLSLFFLFLILILGLVVRIWDLGRNPAGFFCDEASIGYNAYSILKTGKDEWGVTYPLFFKAFGEYKNPLDIYFTVPIVAFFGLNEFSVRMTSVVFSFFTLILFFLIGKKIKNNFFGLLLTLILAINPWHIHLSRVNLEGLQILVFLVSTSIFFLIRFYKDEKNVFISLVLFSIFSSLANYSYFSARIILPIFYIVNLFFIFMKKRSLSLIIKVLLIYFFISLPLFLHLMTPEGLSRWQQVSIFTQNNIDSIKKIFISYSLHFSPDFLFLKGDIGMPGQFITRHSIKGIGQFYLWQLPFIILGFYFLLKSRSLLISTLLFLILILYPLPSSLTRDLSPQATRSIIGIIPFTFFTAFGVDYFLIELRKLSLFIRSVIVFIIIIVIFFSFISFINLLKNYPLYSSDFFGWQYGPRQIIKYFMIEKDNYDELYMTGFLNGPEIFLKFYDPEKKCQNCFVGGIDKYDSNKRQLFALRVEELENIDNIKFFIRKIIYYPSGKKAFYIGEVIKN